MNEPKQQGNGDVPKYSAPVWPETMTMAFVQKLQAETRRFVDARDVVGARYAAEDVQEALNQYRHQAAARGRVRLFMFSFGISSILLALIFIVFAAIPSLTTRIEVIEQTLEETGR